jgi:hypothetical protein
MAGAAATLDPNLRRSRSSTPAANLAHSRRAAMIWSRPNDDALLDEHKLARRAQQGDTESFTSLVRRHQDRIYRLAPRIVGHDAADDVAQQAFLRGWQGPGQFHGDWSFGTWLYRLAMNCSLDHLRHAPRFQPVPLEVVE